MPKAGWGQRREGMPEGRMEEQREGKLAGRIRKATGRDGGRTGKENSGRMGAPGRNATAGLAEC